MEIHKAQTVEEIVEEPEVQVREVVRHVFKSMTHEHVRHVARMQVQLVEEIVEAQ